MKNAFTLAEILITLGVIGIVVAITLTTLINNYQKFVWVNQLKTTYTLLEQGFQKMLADDGVDKLSDTTVFQSMLAQYCSGYSGTCNDFIENLKKYIPIVLISKNIEYSYCTLDLRTCDNRKGENIIQLQNGAFLFSPPTPMFFKTADQGQYSCTQIKNAGGNMCDRQGHIYIDVNGNKKPNRLGRDVYMFKLSGNGHLYGWHGKDDCIWRTLNYEYNTCLAPHCPNVGQGCAARIIQDGWEMNY